MWTGGIIIQLNLKECSQNKSEITIADLNFDQSIPNKLFEDLNHIK